MSYLEERMGQKPNWKPSEKAYLSENWGTVSMGGLIRTLGRSEVAIMIMVQRLGLPPFLESGEYISFNRLIKTVTGKDKNYTHKSISWGEKRGLKICRKLRNRKRIKVVYLDDFWEWAEKNRAYIDFSQMEPLSLGVEPDWVSAQREKDFYQHSLKRTDAWTPVEDSRLKYLLKKHRHGYAELEVELQRTSGAIQRRILDLGLKERPVKAEDSKWTDEHLDILTAGILGGDSYGAIGRMLGRSEKAVRGKVYNIFRTENADRVRTALQSIAQ